MSVHPWVATPFEAFRHNGKQIINLVNLSARGITSVANMPTLTDALYDLDVLRSEQSGLPLPERDEEIARQARLAKSEIESDFTRLHSAGVILLWSALETLTRDLVGVLSDNYISPLATITSPHF